MDKMQHGDFEYWKTDDEQQIAQVEFFEFDGKSYWVLRFSERLPNKTSGTIDHHSYQSYEAVAGYLKKHGLKMSRRDKYASI